MSFAEGSISSGPEGGLSESELSDLASKYRAGNLTFLEVHPGLVNHASRYGLLTKKSPNDSRHIRYTTNPRSTGPDRESTARRSTDNVYISNTNIRCFDGAFYDVRFGTSQNQNAGSATMQLAQLKQGAEVNALCSVLANGIERYRSHWGPVLWQWKYVDNLHDHRHQYSKEQFWSMLRGVDEGEFDQRFIPQSLDDEDVALYIAFGGGAKTIQVHVQKFGHDTNTRLTPLMHLEFFSTPENPTIWDEIGDLPQIHTDVLGDECLQKIKSWVHDCRLNHPNCKVRTGKTVPTRLIRIENRNKVFRIRLIDTEIGRNYRYIALSHAWAMSKPLKTTKKNFREHHEEIPWQNISKVYVDTILLAEALGIEYVWIDSLCIIQQDPEDFQMEAPRMGAVYSNAEIVFAALGGHLGLEKEPAEVVEMQFDHTDGRTWKIPVNVRRVCEHENFVNSANANDSGLYFTRGWCFQERLLSSRIIHFGGSMEDMTFECNAGLKCECGNVELLRYAKDDDEVEISSVWCHIKSQFAKLLFQVRNTMRNSAGSNPATLEKVRNQLLTMYIALCEDFSAKTLTFADDALPATASLTSQLAPYLGSYHAGLWEHNIILQLQWESFNGAESRRYTPCCTPSYSWMSCTGGSIWYFTPETLFAELDQCRFARLISLSTQLEDDSQPFAKISHTFLVIHGVAMTAHIDVSLGVDHHWDKGKLRLADVPSNPWVQIDTLDDIEYLMNGHGEVLLFVLMVGPGARGISYASVLVLVRTTGLNKHQKWYRRVGFGIMPVSAFGDRLEEDAFEVPVWLV